MSVFRESIIDCSTVALTVLASPSVLLLAGSYCASQVVLGLGWRFAIVDVQDLDQIRPRGLTNIDKPHKAFVFEAVQYLKNQLKLQTYGASV